MGDLEDPASLAEVCDGMSTVVHLASHIGDDAARCDRVNRRGTEALVKQAQRAGVQQFIYLSNAAVYGYAVGRGLDEAAAIVAPATPISRSRVGGEEAVLAAGGIVLRPLFVYGEGDTRLIPVIARALRRTPFLLNGGRARVSVIAVTDLARGIVALARQEPARHEAGVFHATDGHPVSFREIVSLMAPITGRTVPRLSMPYSLGRRLMRVARLGRRWTDSDAHRLFLVSHDHWYDAARLWRATGLSEPAPMRDQFMQSAAWYRSVIGAEGLA